MATSRLADHEFIVEGYIIGYHVYQRIWNPTIGEVANAVSEEGTNTHDRYAVAILEEETCCTVGHIPRLISKECHYFLKMGGQILVKITGSRRRSSLPQGGLEIPCDMVFKHKEEIMIMKAATLLKSKGFTNEESPAAEPPKKRMPPAAAENKKPSKRKKSAAVSKRKKHNFHVVATTLLLSWLNHLSYIFTVLLLSL